MQAHTSSNLDKFWQQFSSLRFRGHVNMCAMQSSLPSYIPAPHLLCLFDTQLIVFFVTGVHASLTVFCLTRLNIFPSSQPSCRAYEPPQPSCFLHPWPSNHTHLRDFLVPCLVCVFGVPLHMLVPVSSWLLCCCFLVFCRRHLKCTLSGYDSINIKFTWHYICLCLCITCTM